MSSEVKRYWPEEIVGTGELVVYAEDYAALEAECERLKNSLLEITTRHFAEGWKRSASEKQLEQYLSAGIAQLEAERDALASELAAIKVQRLREALEALVEHFEYYMGDNECRPLENARAALSASTGQEVGK